MPDILGQGGDREPRPWPRRVAVVAVLLLAAVLIVIHLPRHGPGGSLLYGVPTPSAVAFLGL